MLIIWGVILGLFGTEVKAQVLPDILAQQQASQRKIVVILDSGFTEIPGRPRPNFCEQGHQDFTKAEAKSLAQPPLDDDVEKHGSVMAYIVAHELMKVDVAKYCILVFKTKWSITASIQAFDRIADLSPAVAIYATGGTLNSYKEYRAIKKLLDRGVYLSTSAGNDGAWVDGKNKAHFPGAYDSRIFTVGNYQGFITNWGPQVNAVATGPIELEWPLSTSAAAAVFGAELLKAKLNNQPVKTSQFHYRKTEAFRPRSEKRLVEVMELYKLALKQKKQEAAQALDEVLGNLFKEKLAEKRGYDEK